LRRRAEQTDLHAGRREFSVGRRDGEVARCDELAAGRGGDAGNLGDHGLRYGLQRRHQLRAHVEGLAILGDVAAEQFAQIVTGTERRAERAQHDHANAAVLANLGQDGEQLAHDR